MSWKLFILAPVLPVLVGCAGDLHWLGRDDVPVTTPDSTADVAPAVAAPSPPQTEAKPVETDAPSAGECELIAEAATKPAPDSQPALSAASRPGQDESHAPAGSQVVAASILQVNGQFITVRDVMTGARDDFTAIPDDVSELEFRRRARVIISNEVRRQITQTLVLAEAESRQTDEQRQVIDNEVDGTLRRMIAQAGGSRQKLERRFAKSGTTLDEAVEGHRRSITMQLHMQQKLHPQIIVTRRMLWDAYRQNKSRYSHPKKVQMQIIVARFESDQARVEAAEKMAEALEAIHAGEDFGQVARRLSDGVKAKSGGVWPLMAAGNFRHEQVEQAAFELQEGQLSRIIPADGAFFLVKARQVVPASVVSFEEAQEQIGNELREQQYRRLSDEYFDQLTRAARIVQSDRFIETAVDCAVNEYRNRQ